MISADIPVSYCALVYSSLLDTWMLMEMQILLPDKVVYV